MTSFAVKLQITLMKIANIPILFLVWIPFSSVPRACESEARRRKDERNKGISLLLSYVNAQCNVMIMDWPNPFPWSCTVKHLLARSTIPVFDLIWDQPQSNCTPHSLRLPKCSFRLARRCGSSLRVSRSQRMSPCPRALDRAQFLVWRRPASPPSRTTADMRPGSEWVRPRPQWILTSGRHYVQNSSWPLCCDRLWIHQANSKAVGVDGGMKTTLVNNAVSSVRLHVGVFPFSVNSWMLKVNYFYCDQELLKVNAVGGPREHF